jgi:hypothetical protein
MDYHFEHYRGKRIEGNWPDRILIMVDRRNAAKFIVELAKQLEESKSDDCTLCVVGRLEEKE